MQLSFRQVQINTAGEITITQMISASMDKVRILESMAKEVKFKDRVIYQKVRVKLDTARAELQRLQIKKNNMIRRGLPV